MSYKIEFTVASSEQIEQALCQRLQTIRLARNITQIGLAREAGVSERTIRRMENGGGTSLDTFVRVLIALGLQTALAGLLPDPTVRPVERAAGKRERQRARLRPTPPGQNTFRWGDEGQ
jgi:transcriptional regulator with XRE-family HTH domain